MAEIRMIVEADVNELKQVLDSIELFPPAMLEGMISEYLNNLDSEEMWITGTEDNIPISIGYCAPEKLTDGTFNLYAIGIKSELQGKGIGSKMMNFIEDHLKSLGHRILIVETSGAEEFKMTRDFYSKLNY